MKRRLIALAVAVALALLACKSPSSSSDKEDKPDGGGSPTAKVSVGMQNGALTGAAAGSASFPVATTNIADGTTGTISWCDASGAAASAPVGISAAVSAVAANAASINVNADDTAVAGSYYFTLSIASTRSGIATLELASPTSLSLSFDANGGSGTMPAQTLAPGASITLPANTLTAPSGSSFAGWTTSITSSGTSYGDKASFSMSTNANVKLYAIWLPTGGFSVSGNTITLTSVPTSTIGAYTIPYGVTAIAGSAFINCNKITSVTIPGSVTSIGQYAFLSCSSLTSVTIPSSVTSIEHDAFAQTGLTSVIIPTSVTRIEQQVFYFCDRLTSVSIPSSITSIEQKAFYGCGKLASVTIPSSVISIGQCAFANCSELSQIVVDSQNPSYSSDNFGVLFNKDKTSLIQAPGVIISYSIPSSVTSIEAYSFYLCKNLTSISIPSSVTSIGDCAFEHCESLTSVTIPSLVISIGRQSFTSCILLSSVTVQAATPPVLTITQGYTPYYNNFGGAPGLQFHVPSGSLSAYKNAAGWSNFASAIFGY